MTGRIQGLSIELGLDTLRLSSGLSDLRSRLSTVNSEMRANLSAFDRGDRSINRYQTTLNGLNRKVQVQREITARALTTYERMVQEFGEGSREAERAARQYNNQAAALNNLERDIERTTEELERLRREQRIAESGWGRMGTSLTNVSGRMITAGQNMQNVGSSMRNSFGIATAAVGGFFVLATKKSMDFEAQLSSMKSVMDPQEAKEFGGELEKLAITMGAKTKYSALEAAQGIEELVKAGVSVTDILQGGLEGALSLATAGELELADAAEIASTALNAFKDDGLSVSKAADILAGAANASATSVGEIKYSLAAVSAVASGVGLTFKDTSTALAVFAQNGLKGSDAGTSLKTMLLRLSPQTKAAYEAFDQLGLSSYNTTAGYKYLVSKGLEPTGRHVEDLEKGLMKLTEQELGAGASKAELKKRYEENLQASGLMSSAFYDEQGELKSMAEIAGLLQNSMKDLNDEQRQNYLNTMFGSDAIRAGNILFKEGAKGIEQMAASMDKIKAADVAAEKLNNLKGQMEELSGAAETGLISLGSAITPLVSKVVVVLQSLVDKFNSLSPKMQSTIAIGGVLTTVFLALGTGLGIMLTILGGAISGLGALAGALAPVMTSIARAGGLLKWLRLGLVAFTGPIGLTIGALTLLGTGFVTLYAKSETFREGVNQLFVKIKQLASDALKALQPAIAAVVKFFQDQLAVIQQFWRENSSTILAALKNIGSFIKVIMDGILATIKFVMPFILVIIKSVWGNIQGVIKGALNVIMGAVKVFAGLFSGDFSKMWEGLKQIFTGAITFIWNLIQLSFYGKLLSGAKAFFTPFRAGFTSLWNSIRSIFTTVINAIINFVKGSWANLNTITTSYFNLMFRFYGTIWNAIRNVFTTVINGIFNFVKQIWLSLSSNTTSIFTVIRNTLTSIWNSIKNSITSIATGIWNSVKSTWNNVLTTTTNVFRGVYNTVNTQFTNIINRAKELPKKIGDGIGSMASKVKEGVNKVVNSMAGTLGKGINGVIGGVNWVLDKIGITSKVSEWPVPQYAKGTDGHPGGLAIVGDGVGSNAGEELIQTPDGKQYLSPNKPSLVNLPKGTHVLSATLTKQLFDVPKYSWGTLKGWAANAWSKGKEAVSNIKDTALDVWSYISDPGKLFNKALETFGVQPPNMPGMLKGIGTGAYNKVKDSMKEWLSKQVGSMFEGGGGFGGGTGGKGWPPPFRLTSPFNPTRRHPITGQIKPHRGDDWAAPTGTPIPAQAAGKVSFSGWARGYGNLIRIVSGAFERYYGHNHRNLVNVGQIVKAGQTIGLTGSTGDSTGPHVHYEVRKNGVPINPRGFKTGGLIKKSGLYPIAEGGHPEWIIPTDPSKRTDAMKLLALAGKEIQGNKRPHQLPNVGGGGSDNGLLQAVLEQNKILMALLQSSKNIEMKPVLSEGDIGKAAERYDARQSSKHSVYSGRVAF
ncbi:phage tail tape measure protein [Bacillus lacus]|uniref:Phage tail tape measure protein n=1 Tax=Metabacillus lacus TaxID=1983721 RepID=A0A7X2IXB2_9BACI|nr:phage tail tape measure protein [Metabacillus lacus]MRX70843.1 phage tail tape measure protein [Metabacillus lacus]